MKKLPILSLLILILISGCKKYPDGPLISLRTKQHRMTGRWVVLNYTVDGFDSTAQLQSQPYYGIYNIYPKSDGLNEWVLGNTNGNFLIDGTWEFESNRDEIRFDAHSAVNVNSPFANSSTSWEIRRLTKDDLWLKTDYNGKTYFMKMKKNVELKDI